MSFMDLTKNELLKAANFYKVDVASNDNKEEITLALTDAGKTPEQWEEDKEAHVNGLPEEAPRSETTEPEAPAADDEEEEEEPAAEEEPEAMVLVRFTGKNRSYSVGRHTFSAAKPFALMPEAAFNGLDRARFREATKREAQAFYGQ
jgi:hypothetical protein